MSSFALLLTYPSGRDFVGPVWTRFRVRQQSPNALCICISRTKPNSAAPLVNTEEVDLFFTQAQPILSQRLAEIQKKGVLISWPPARDIALFLLMAPSPYVTTLSGCSKREGLCSHSWKASRPSDRWYVLNSDSGDCPEYRPAPGGWYNSHRHRPA